MSTVQNSSVAVHMDDQSLPYHTELQALGRKDAATIATALIELFCSLLETLLGESPQPDKPVRIPHLVTGDGINTNAAALAIVMSYFQRAWAKKSWNSYRVLNWQRSSHRANLVAQFVVCSGQRNSALRAICSRIYKYITPAYADSDWSKLSCLRVGEHGFPS